ncbi:MAG TPA: NAD(P)/FAD-dependent oxidoreductase [Candidatus Paceibacterota bacterium]|nr:NAD(P)/FAD-dependent oxidoreductase [Candidatus Paceibacterota bacterium]HRZ56139.1 NAD(P)/FAD-dependent oxidoreductase [Candidatus Paceibacterota bacterium]
MPSKHQFDAVVLGAGSAGFAAARTAAAAGLNVAVVDGAPELGGLCILRGCMPTKTLLEAAHVRHLAQRSGTWGVRVPEAQFDWPAILRRKDELVRGWAEYRREQLNGGKFALIRAQARFLDPHRLVLDDGQTVEAPRFVIATGSVVSPPPLPQLEAVGCLTSDDALSLDTPPRSMIVLGGGPVALEFAQFFARLDVEVTLVQRSDHVLRGLDDDTAQAVEAALRREGLRVLTGTRLVGAARNASGTSVRFERAGRVETAAADQVLLALGRSPNTAALDLEKADVRTEKGRILANAEQQTSAPHIYAAGDCCGPHDLVHLAVQQGEVAGHNLAHANAPRRMDYRLLVRVVFTEPQVAAVGFTEKEARAAGLEPLVASYPFSDHGKSVILDARDGFVKLLADARTGEIMGASVVGPLGGELIHEIVAAMHGRMTVQQLAALPHYHPTLAEIWTYPAEDLAASQQSMPRKPFT